MYRQNVEVKKRILTRSKCGVSHTWSGRSTQNDNEDENEQMVDVSLCKWNINY